VDSKHLLKKMTALVSPTPVRVVVYCKLSTQLQRSRKLKISHWLFWSVFNPSDFVFCQDILCASVLVHSFYSVTTV